MECVEKRGHRFRLRAAVVAFALAAAVAALFAGTAAGKPSASPLKVAIMSDCKGAFGAFYNSDIAGSIAAFSQFTGAKPKDPTNPSAGMVGGSIGGHPIQVVGFGCGNDTVPLAISEIKRLMEQLGAELEIGPLSGAESIAIANYAKAHPTKTFMNGTAGAQETTLKVRAPNFFRFNGDGAQWNAGIGEIAYNRLHWRKVALIEDDYAFAYVLINNYTHTLTVPLIGGSFNTVIGLIFLAIVLLSPDGLLGVWDWGIAHLRRRGSDQPAAAPEPGGGTA